MPKILSTKCFNPVQRNLLLQTGLSYVEYSAIKIKFNTDTDLPLQCSTAIFTSKNAVLAVSDKVGIKEAFCVGRKVQKMLEDRSIEVIHQEGYAQMLAERIVKDYSDRKYDFFCGNRRRNTLPAALSKSHIRFNEYQVYSTVLNPQKCDPNAYDGIFFFSPSGVQSFIKANNAFSIPAFCIGTTTAAEAQKFFSEIVVANFPSVENVISKAAFYFDSK